MPEIVNNRYEIEEPPFGRGGMGAIYKAFDHITKRHVAVKALTDHTDSGSMQMFAREWSILASISHPNIVDILDIGEWVTASSRRPFFVMPLLPGTSLDRLLRDQSSRLTLKRVVDIVAQACRGLQAAHERGLVHRDIKPSNIFVLEDDAVKVIDFGVAHLAGTKSVTGLKGTLPYMAPEQVRMESSTPASDIFSLGVVAYEALSGRKPFARANDAETAQAVLRHIPPPANEVNSGVPEMVARVVHKAMAKQALHRFTSCRDFGECLQRATAGEYLERFDVARIQPRIQRAQRAFADGDYQFAQEVLDEVEAEGHVDSQIKTLRVQIRDALRQKNIRHLIESARTRMEEEEFPLALQKLQDALELDPRNAEALGLRAELDRRRNEKQSANWLLLARQHLETRSFARAKEALREVLAVNPLDKGALDLLAETERREVEYNRAREQKERLYQSAVAAFDQGEISSALSRLESLLELNRKSPNSVVPERDSVYQDFYNRVRSERDELHRSYLEGKRLLDLREFAKALAICDEVLLKRPATPMFQALRLEIEEQQRQERSAFIAEVTRRVDAERILDRRLDILKEAVDRFPDESYFQQALRLNRERRDLVSSIEGKARVYEERGQFTEAIAQLDILQSIYPEHPTVAFDVDRLALRREQQSKETAKGQVVEEIDRYLEAGEYQRAAEITAQALCKFQNDAELLGLQQLAQQGLTRQTEAREWLTKGQQFCSNRQFAEGLQALQRAGELDPRNSVIRTALLGALIEQARSLLVLDWRAAEPLIQRALALDLSHPLAKSLAALIADYRKQETVDQHAGRARELQVQGDVAGASAEVERGLALYPGEPRLTQIQNTLRATRAASGEKSALTQDDEQSQALSMTPFDLSGAAWETPRTLEPETQHGVPDPPVASPAERRSVLAPGLGQPASTRLAAARNALGRVRLPGIQQAIAWLTLKPAYAGAITAVLVLLAATGIYVGLRSEPEPVPARHVQLSVATQPTGASILLDGKRASFPMELPAGKYIVEAALPGYKTRSEVVEISASSPQAMTLRMELEAEPHVIHITTDIRTGKVLINGQEIGELQAGEYSAEMATAGDYSVSITDQTGEVLATRFRIEPGNAPELLDSVRTRETAAIVVAAFGTEYTVFTSSATAKAKLPGGEPNVIPPEGMRIQVPPEPTLLEIADGTKSPQIVTLERTSAPMLDIRLMSDRSTGTLLVEANVQGATVFLNGQPHGRALQNGRWRSNLEPKEYVVRVVAEGYEDAEQTFRINKGETGKLQFELKPRVVMSALSISGGTPEAEVLLDGKRVGLLSSSGALKLETSPGEHTIELRKENHEPRSLKRVFAAGQSVAISARESALQPYGTLEYRINPPNARVGFTREGQTQSSAAEPGQSVRVPAGRYTVEASADKHQPRKETLSVAAGQTTAVVWTLEPVKLAPPPARVMRTPDYFADPGALKEENGWFVLPESDGYKWLNTKGPLRMDIQKLKEGFFGSSRIEWVIDYRDNRNYVLFSLSNNELKREVVVNGRKDSKNSQTVAFSLGKSPYHSLQVTIEPKRIVHRDATGRVINAYGGDGDFTAGRWGVRATKNPVTLKIHN